MLPRALIPARGDVNTSRRGIEAATLAAGPIRQRIRYKLATSVFQATEFYFKLEVLASVISVVKLTQAVGHIAWVFI